MQPFAKTALGALTLAISAPLTAQSVGTGEINLRIEVTAQVAPDTAMVPINLVGTGPDEKTAAMDLKAREVTLLTALARLGIGADKVEFQAEDDPRYAEIRTIEIETDAAAAACDAAAEMSGPNSVNADAACKAPSPNLRASRMAFVTVEDLTKLPAVSELGGNDSYYPATQTNLYTRDPAVAKARAVQQAIAQARAEADIYAAAMGYRVVRIQSVSNAKPVINLPDIVGLIGGFAMQGRSSRDEMRALAGSTTAGAAIDFIIAPK